MVNENEIPAHLIGRPDWQNKPFRMNKFELEYPLIVIEHYHRHFPLPEVRDYFKELVWDAANSEAPSDNDNLSFQAETEKFIEAAFWMYESGRLGLPPETDEKRRSFLKVFYSETSRLMTEIFTLMGTIGDGSDSSNLTSDTQDALIKARMLAWQVSNANSNLALMVDYDKNYPSKLPSAPATIVTAEFIEKCTTPFQYFMTHQGLQINIKDIGGPTVTIDTAKLDFLIKNFLHTAFNFCQPPAKVQLDCVTCFGSLEITVTFEARLHKFVHRQEYFHPYDLTSSSAIAGVLLYMTNELAVDKGIYALYGDKEATLRAWVPFIKEQNSQSDISS